MNPWDTPLVAACNPEDVRDISERAQALAESLVLDPAQRERLKSEIEALETEIERLRPGAEVLGRSAPDLALLFSEAQLDVLYARDPTVPTSLRLAHFMRFARPQG